MAKGRPRLVEAIAARLAALIRDRGTTVLTVERHLGKRPGYLQSALKGHKRLTLELLAEVIDYLGVEPEELFATPPTGADVAEHLEDYRPDEVARAVARALIRKGILSPGDIDPKE